MLELPQPTARYCPSLVNAIAEVYEQSFNVWKGRSVIFIFDYSVILNDILQIRAFLAVTAKYMLRWSEIAVEIELLFSMGITCEILVQGKYFDYVTE